MTRKRRESGSEDKYSLLSSGLAQRPLSGMKTKHGLDAAEAAPKRQNKLLKTLPLGLILHLLIIDRDLWVIIVLGGDDLRRQRMFQGAAGRQASQQGNGGTSVQRRGVANNDTQGVQDMTYAADRRTIGVDGSYKRVRSGGEAPDPGPQLTPRSGMRPRTFPTRGESLP
jgi:hypothetical protein